MSRVNSGGDSAIRVVRVAVSKVERLMNLVIALLSTRSYITAEKIRSSVAGYADSASDEAFSRMFERDKNELRDLGIPLETGRVSSFDPIEGYRINRDAYALPAVELTGDEAAAVAVATQLWESPELITATQGALLKLRAAGVDVDPLAPIAIASPAGRVGLRGSEDVLGLLLSAIGTGQAVQFPHRPSRTDPYTVRTVEPWGVVTEKGRWYLVGHDRDRGATRTFRLSRIGDEVTTIGPTGAVTRPVDADLRETEKILDHARGLLDFSQPVAVMLVAVLHLIGPEDHPYSIVSQLVDAVPPGSYLLLSHVASDIEPEKMAEMGKRLNRLLAQKGYYRSQAEVADFFAGLDLVEPGVVPVQRWRQDSEVEGARKAAMWGGVARKHG